MNCKQELTIINNIKQKYKVLRWCSNVLSCLNVFKRFYNGIHVSHIYRKATQFSTLATYKGRPTVVTWFGTRDRANKVSMAKDLASISFTFLLLQMLLFFVSILKFSVTNKASLEIYMAITGLWLKHDVSASLPIHSIAQAITCTVEKLIFVIYWHI